jgi:hypothetical protein
VVPLSPAAAEADVAVAFVVVALEVVADWVELLAAAAVGTAAAAAAAAVLEGVVAAVAAGTAAVLVVLADHYEALLLDHHTGSERDVVVAVVHTPVVLANYEDRAHFLAVE